MSHFRNTVADAIDPLTRNRLRGLTGEPTPPKPAAVTPAKMPSRRVRVTGAAAMASVHAAASKQVR